MNTVKALLTIALGSQVLLAGAVKQGENTTTYRKVENQAFVAGEELRYRLHYGFVDAGEAVLKVKECEKKINGRKLFHVEGVGKSISAFDWFYVVRDRYESYIDSEGMFPWLFVRRVNEGGYIINQDYTYLQHKKKVDNGAGKTFDVPEAAQDMISAFYYARTIDFSKAKVGEEFTIPLFYDDTNFPLKIRYMGKETIKLRMGKFKCLKFAPVVEKGRIFKTEDDLSVWISDDQNKIPLLAKAKILVGSIKMEVVEYKNLAGPISEVK